MRTVNEIVKRMKELEKEDLFGFQRGDLLEFLSYKEAKEFITAEAQKKIDSGEDKWSYRKLTQAKVLKEMKKYMEFALGKAEGHRGLSADRSIQHYKAWVWLLGDEDYKSIDWGHYQNYGVPILKQICDKYGFVFPKNNEVLMNMSVGRLCYDLCESGCGR